MSTCSIKFLGTSDGLPSAERNHASVLVNLGERTYLFDCGEPVSHTLKQNGVSYDLFDRLFISHLHADHCGGLPMLMQSCWLEARRKPLPVHMPAEGIRPFRRLLQATYLFEGLLPFSCSMHALKARQPIRDGNIQVVAHPTTHLLWLKRGFGKRYKVPFESFCFEVIIGNRKRIGYSADIGAPSDLDPLVSEPLDVLVVELSHFTDKKLFEYLRGKPIRQVVLTHLSRQYYKNPAVPKLGRECCGDKRLLIAKDGMEVRF